MNWSVLVFSAGFMKLLDNYVMATGTAERITPEEVTENNQFLDAILETEVMKVRPGISLPKPQTNLSLGAHCFSQSFLEIKCFELHSTGNTVTSCHTLFLEATCQRQDKNNTLEQFNYLFHDLL